METATEIQRETPKEMRTATGGNSPKSDPEKVAVIIPLYNKAQYIGRTLTSVLAQTQPPHEIVIVDDGSTDGSLTVVRSWIAEQFAALHSAEIELKILQQTQTGPGAARNRGAQAATAPLLAFLDADDEWLPEFLAQATAALRAHPNCALASFGQFHGTERSSLQPRFEALGIQAGAWRLPAQMRPQQMKPTLDFIFSGATVVRRVAVEELGGFYAQAGCTYGEDSYFWLQVALHYPIYRDPTPLMWYHTECSELGMWNREVPLSPILQRPEPLRSRCPEAYRLFLEQYLAQLAIITARRFAHYGDRDTARDLLARFPLSRTFHKDNAKANLEIMLANFPQLRSWILNARFSA